MLETIQVMLEAVSKMASSIEGLEKKKLKAIGVRFLILYFRVNEVIETAHEIIKHIESIREVVDSRMRIWNENIDQALSVFTPEELGNELLQEQGLNLERLDAALYSIEYELKLLDPQSEKKLESIARSKWGRLTDVVNLFHGVIAFPSTEFMHTKKSRRKINWDKRIGININALDANGYLALIKYVDSGIPCKQIEEFQKVSNNLRKVIEKNWSVVELLPGTTKAIHN